MNWFAHVDGYCERLGPGLWAEPVNALTNLAFIVAALVLWPGRTDRTDAALVAILFVIGIGSGAFHTFANPLTGMMDVLPIAAFVFVYIAAAARDFLGLRGARVVAGFIASVAFMVLGGWLLGRAVPGLGASAAYAGVDLLIWGYAVLVWRDRRLALGLALGAGLLALSITARALDEPLCAAWPQGTHFGWHILNAAMLAWMIVLRRRHLLAAGGARG